MSHDKRKGKRILNERRPMGDVGLPSYTLQEAVNYVVKVKRASNLKERTIRGYITNMAYFNDWIEDRYGISYINDVTTDMIREYVLWCAKEKAYYEGHPYKDRFYNKTGMSSASVNVRLRVMRTFFRTMFFENIINYNPMETISLLRQDVDTVQPLNEEELSRLLKAPDKKMWAQWRDYVIMVLILDTGMRLNEICSLEKHECDFVQKIIELPASKNKNRKNRVLPISTETTRLLRQLIKETEQAFDSTYVFTTNYGNQLSEKTIQKALTKYAEKARLGRNVSPHVLRHNFATMAAESGMSIFHLQKIMGHADIVTTRKYVQLSTDSIVDEHRLHSPLGRIMKRK